MSHHPISSCGAGFSLRRVACFQHTLSVLLALLLALPVVGAPRKPSPADTAPEQMERLDRGLVVMPSARAGAKQGDCILSWRLLATEPADQHFTILRNGKPYRENITGPTWIEATTGPDDQWQVVCASAGEVAGDVAFQPRAGGVGRSPHPQRVARMPRPQSARGSDPICSYTCNSQ